MSLPKNSAKQREYDRPASSRCCWPMTPTESLLDPQGEQDAAAGPDQRADPAGHSPPAADIARCAGIPAAGRAPRAVAAGGMQTSTARSWWKRRRRCGTASSAA